VRQLIGIVLDLPASMLPALLFVSFTLYAAWYNWLI
jgi:hypothetical protein